MSLAVGLAVKGDIQSEALISRIFHADYLLVNPAGKSLDR